MFGLALTGVVLAMTLTGCFTDRKEARGATADDEPRARPAVAVAPFKSLSQAPDSGALVASAMASEMRALGGYQVIVPGDGTGGGDADWDMDADDLGDAPYVLTGRVTSYGGKSGGGEHPTVGVAAKLVERETGNVLWSGTRTRKGSAAWFQEDSLGVLASRVCGDLAKSLDDHIGKDGLQTTLAAKEPPPPSSPRPEKSDTMLASAAKPSPSRTKKTTAKKDSVIAAKEPATAKKEAVAAKPRTEPKQAAPARQQPIEKEQAKAAPKKAAGSTALSASAKHPPAQPVASDATGLAAAIIGAGGGEAEPVGSFGKAEEDANGFSSLRPPGNLKSGTRIVSQPVYPNGPRKASPERLRPGEREPDQVLRLTIPSQPQASIDRQYEEAMYQMHDQRLTGEMM